MSVIGLLGFGLTVPDLANAEKFYSAFGLETARKDGALVVRSPGRTHDEGILIEGPAKRLHHASFAVDRAGYDAALARLKTRGIRVQDEPPKGVPRGGAWFEDPWGTWVNLTLEPLGGARDPQNPGVNTGGRAERMDGALWQEVRREPKPRRLGHMIIYLKEWLEAEKFYADVVGLRVSDRVTGRITFLAGTSGDHHCFGIAASTHRGYQHASFEVDSIDALGFGRQRMHDAGYTECYGPGRHAVASNLFHYTRDPWGSWIEYYADMDKITDKWVARDWETPPVIWGPQMSATFFRDALFNNTEAQP
jgi:catechol-2,3-dioxygenase